MKTETDRRIGRVEIDTLAIDHDERLVRIVMAGCIPLRAEALHHRRCIDIIALHPDFDPVPFGNDPPRYDAMMHDQHDGTPIRTWRKRA